MIKTGAPGDKGRPKNCNRYLLPSCMQITGWPVKLDCYFSSGSEKYNGPALPGGATRKWDGLLDVGRAIRALPYCGTDHRRALCAVQVQTGTGRWSLR